MTAIHFMNKADILKQIVEIGVVPVIRADSADQAAALINAIADGGVTAIEVTMTVPDAVELITDLSNDERLLIGAGTVLDAETADRCIKAGAKFVVSPALNIDTIRLCNKLQIPVMPGAITPTEVVNAWQAGADIVKIFPAGAMGGASYLRSLKAPLPHIRLMPTGGVNKSNAAEMIKAGAEAIGVGADLADLNALRSGDTTSITRSAKEYLEIVKNAR